MLVLNSYIFVKSEVVPISIGPLPNQSKGTLFLWNDREPNDCGLIVPWPCQNMLDKTEYSLMRLKGYQFGFLERGLGHQLICGSSHKLAFLLCQILVSLTT